jgi:hypothetical protein
MGCAFSNAFRASSLSQLNVEFAKFWAAVCAWRVSIVHGQIAFTQILYGAKSMAVDFASCAMAALVVQYTLDCHFQIVD